MTSFRIRIPVYFFVSLFSGNFLGINHAFQIFHNRLFVPSHALPQKYSSYDDDDDGFDELHAADSERRSFFRHTGSILMGVTTTATPIAHAATVVVPTSNMRSLFPTPPNSPDLSWPLGKVAFSLLPLAGTSTRRATLEQEIVPDTIWTHDQIQGIVNVNVPVRQTVIRLQRNGSGGGGLWVHNPVAPTPQLLQMMNRLIREYGPVRHIVLGTVALEHKATLPAFASYFPKATVWLQPGQWSFPFSIPIEYYGLVQRGSRLREIPRMPTTIVTETDRKSSAFKREKYRYYAELDPIPEWADEIDYEVLGPFKFQSVGGFSETSFFHKATKSLIVTDCVVSVTKDPPPIISEDPRALLFHARDYATENILEDTPEIRAKGWRRMVQFGLVFFPSQITVVPTLSQAITDANNVRPELRNLGDGAIPLNGALYPWTWNPNDADQLNFDYISQNGKLFCPPILTKLILDREPVATLEFVDRVCTRFSNMKRIIPCHLNNNVEVKGSNDFYQAFDMLRSLPGNPKPQRALPEDLALLQKASDVLTQTGVVGPSVICDGEPARRIGRFAKVQ
jgi:Domain of unknown function (DUF4336)